MRFRLSYMLNAVQAVQTCVIILTWPEPHAACIAHIDVIVVLLFASLKRDALFGLVHSCIPYFLAALEHKASFEQLHQPTGHIDSA